MHLGLFLHSSSGRPLVFVDLSQIPESCLGLAQTVWNTSLGHVAIHVRPVMAALTSGLASEANVGDVRHVLTAIEKACLDLRSVMEQEDPALPGLNDAAVSRLQLAETTSVRRLMSLQLRFCGESPSLLKQCIARGCCLATSPPTCNLS